MSIAEVVLLTAFFFIPIAVFIGVKTKQWFVLYCIIGMAMGSGIIWLFEV